MLVTITLVPGKFKSISNVSRFYMEEDSKGRGKEKFPLSLNIIAKH